MSPGRHSDPPMITVGAVPMMRLAGIAVLVFVVIVLVSSGTYVVQPGYRGVAVTLGRVSPDFKPEGFGFKKPFITHIQPMSVRQQTRTAPAECYSSDLQTVKMVVNILYRVPEQSVVKVFQQYAGEPFDNLIAPRVQEAIKEVAATMSAEQIVKRREDVKQMALDLARKKIGADFLDVVDIVLYNIQLSPELEQAIEQKMVQEQEAAKAKFTQMKAQIEAQTAVIRAKGEAEAIAVRGSALRTNPEFIKLQIIQNWNGHSPLVVGADGAANMLLQLDKLNNENARPGARQRTTSATGAPTRNR